jgi:acyl-CoA thioesterase-2
VSFAEMIELQRVGESRFTASGPRSPWGFLYGGQAIAQAARAAAATVDSNRAINSLHAYYVRAGVDHEPLELVTERVRDGRSFSVRSVAATQAGATIATVLLSFHVSEESQDRSPLTVPPAVPAPDTLADDGWSVLSDRRHAPTDVDRARSLAWMRIREPLGEDPVVHACALIYLADDIFDEPACGLLGLEPEGDASIQSLDIALWFHRPARADGWLLLDYRCESYVNGCAMVVGEVFDHTGAHIATAAQQVLIREPL